MFVSMTYILFKKFNVIKFMSSVSDGFSLQNDIQILPVMTLVSSLIQILSLSPEITENWTTVRLLGDGAFGKLLNCPADLCGVAWMVLHPGADRCVHLVARSGEGSGRRDLGYEPPVQQHVFHFAPKFPGN